MTYEQAQLGVKVATRDPVYFSRSEPPLPAGQEGVIERRYLEDDIVFQVRLADGGVLFYTDQELDYLEILP